MITEDKKTKLLHTIQDPIMVPSTSCGETIKSMRVVIMQISENQVNLTKSKD